jgi:hypothetical protein
MVELNATVVGVDENVIATGVALLEKFCANNFPEASPTRVNMKSKNRFIVNTFCL